ncbi:MAG TPA: hypothetical protein ENH41_01055 [Candidatus Omnitrophica bacterium]|nr:hypothetical protein [Candidatus Omnitrophota bacterium]
MLIIALHNSQAYLGCINELAKKEGIGTYLTEEHVDIIARMGMSHLYDKALIAIVEGEEKAKHFLNINIVEESNILDPLNSDNTGFICAVPFGYIKHLELESSHREKKKQ